MVLATLILACAFPQAADAAKLAGASNGNVDRQILTATVFDNAFKDTTAAAALPSTPEPKAKPEVASAALRSAAQPFEPVRPVARRPGETPRQRKMWYGLMVVAHAGAGFDAWTTRQAVSSGYGREADPFMKPFANSNAIYVATQASPAFMDYLGKRMMVSQNPWVRKLWWVPQTAGASLSFVAGAHNLSVAHY
ncbi:MAG: hypothetical protein DMG39_13280 [Acidobacteria bacterium]|nr:MAG: hypothetical protein DMG39_13280 [Acidobacteriota bacterium]